MHSITRSVAETQGTNLKGMTEKKTPAEKQYNYK
jgi:hypothetical protein